MAAVTMVMPALGRPFRLGMLYDSRNDQLIPGVTLWDYETLQKDTKATPQPSSVFEITTSDSMDEKSSKLQVDASLKASFMGGLIQVDGSANYLNDKKKSNDHTRVTLQYKVTKFQELFMTQLGKDNMQYPDDLHKDIATHVVTGIQYGAQAFFVFDSEKSETSNVQDIQGTMKAVIRKIPMLDIEGEASLKITDEEKAISKTMSCKFHGDFNLEANPTSFEEAVKVYHDLPKLLGEDGESFVPQKVWLMPLTILDSEAARLIHEISLGLVEQMQDTLEDFSQLEVRCNDALRKVQHFPQIVGQLKDFRAKCLQFMIILKKHMVTNLPLIRGGEKDENVLKKVLEERQDSPFSTKMLSKWMDGKEREINVIRALVDMMEGTKIASDQNELDREVLNPKVKQVVCFAFTSLDTTDAFLTALSDHLTSTQPGRAQDVKPCMADEELVQQTKQWYYSDDVYSMMREKANRFIHFARANKSKKKMSFLIAAIANPKHQGASIYQYLDGIQITDDFNISDPGDPARNLLKNPNGDGRAQDVKPCMADEELVQQTKQWYYSDDVYSTMREKANRFIHFAIANKSKKKMSFLIAAIANPKHQGASIYQYLDGIQITDDFMPSDPRDPARNLLKNPNGDEKLESWVFMHKSDWYVKKLPGDCGRLTEFHNEGVTKFFATPVQYSNFPCLKTQVIDLLAEGFSSEDLDAQPTINVKDWYSGRRDCCCFYKLHVCLLGENQELLQEFIPDGVTLRLDSDETWRQVKHTFSDYGPGVRFISFEHGGKWVKVTGSAVTMET